MTASFLFFLSLGCGARLPGPFDGKAFGVAHSGPYDRHHNAGHRRKPCPLFLIYR
jgi:hypothetical protein